MMTLEERIARLEDIESIRYLQAKYQRCLDTRDFDGLEECFSENAVSSYGNGKMSYQGKSAVLNFLRGAMTLDMPSTHLIHSGEIDVLDVAHASAKWYLEDYLIHRKYQMKLHGAAIYCVDYEKIDGEWKISSIGYERCYEYFELRGLMNLLSLRETTFLNRAKIQSPVREGKFRRFFRQYVFKKKCK